MYWADLAVSAGLGWLSFVAAVRSAAWTRAGATVVAIFSLYRAVLFIHEITHLSRRDLPWFRVVWNAIVGVPLLIPSFLYENVHTEHHRQRSYGTEADPEYVPYGRRSPLLIVSSLAGALLVPVALAVRFGILAPLSWLVPPLGRLVAARASALVINHRFLRRAPIGAAGRVEEAAAFAVVWTTLGLWRAGIIDGDLFRVWFLVGAAISVVNAVRTLAAHRYDLDEGEVSMVGQLLDSCTIAPPAGAARRISARLLAGSRALAAPVGLRYHALHHWIPSLPYHNLGRVHRLLVSRLGADAPYHATVKRGLFPTLADLVRRSRRATE